jgi:nitrogenase cofactor biosynthesis protein NifB
MPLGAVSAFFGIRGCMSILHGSQGCATYIRRHMATHYNEPIDIASSSLTEQGTVFGGEKNLIKGLENLIDLYHPEVIGVATTCLAETIGEDVPAIIKHFYETHPNVTAKIISVPSPGYAGTQYEGFFRSLHALVSQTEQNPAPNGKINIISPMLSPADYRYIKSLIAHMGLDAIFLPDLADNLDGVSQKRYNRLPEGGTPISDIALMAGAVKTIEFTALPNPDASPAQHLYEKFGVPFIRLPVPCGLRATDALVRELTALGGIAVEELRSERGRLVDAMVDAHKHSAEARAAIFGEPDFVYSAARMCFENGIVPEVIATGSVCPQLRELLESEANEAAAHAFADPPAILNDCDFDTIEHECKTRGVNIMIGSSDGRRVARRLGIGLIRCAFPIHDQVGGQSVRIVGYKGTQELMQKIANQILLEKEENYRDEQAQKYLSPKKEEPKTAAAAPVFTAWELAEKTRNHPCFTCGSCDNARIHLPIAPKCNIQCNYCVRKYDCANESRPGVTSGVLTPEQAAEKYIRVKKEVENLKVVGIAGPGDALADFELTKQTLRRIRESDPDVTFCLSTNGLMLPVYAQELVELGVSHVTVTINAIDPKIGAKIYSHVDYFGTRFIGEAAASLLLAGQLAGIKYLINRGVVVKVNTVVLKGINDSHIEEVVKKVAELGVYITNIMQLIPVPESSFEHMELVSNRELGLIRKSCEKYVKQMYHCKQCRADAIGTLANDRSIEFRDTEQPAETVIKDKPYRIAVASRSGMTVDTHFGQAEEFYIYDSDGKTARFVEKRTVSKYCTGIDICDDENKIDRIIKTIYDCETVLSLRIGSAPSKKLADAGIKSFCTYELVEPAVLKAVNSK